MQRITVSRNDDIYEAFADVAQATDGTLVCTYRESMCHSSRPWSKVIVRRSHDRGLTWGPRQVVYERTREESAAGKGRLNCSRITACADGTLLLIVDMLLKETAEEYLEPGVCMNLLFRSQDQGATWEGPEETGITEGIVPSIKELTSGDLIIGVTEQRAGEEASGDIETQTTYLSSDRGKTWEGPFKVPDPGVPTITGQHWRLNEGDFAELDDGTLVLYMREDGERLSGWKSISRDGGRTWSEPLRTQMMHCLGRPSVGRLRSGEIAITYRVCCGLSTALGLHVETPEEALRGFPAQSGDPENPEDYSGDTQVRFAFLDNDRALSPDSGYSGWVQLPGGDLYVVNYVTDDAPRAHIRGYCVGREDWYLFPEGAIRRSPPLDREGRYYEAGQAMAREQQAWVDAQDWSYRVPTQK